MPDTLFIACTLLVILVCIIDNIRTRRSMHRRIVRLADALQTSYRLILRHHDCGKPIVWGQFCPHCRRPDGTEPELDQIAKALKEAE